LAVKRATLKIAASLDADRDDHSAMARALERLRDAALNTVADVVAPLSPSERARLAIHCYGRAHLNRIGLAIAAQCDLDHLIAASHSAAAGRALYAQAREPWPAEKPVYGRRLQITLARSAPCRLGSLIPDLLRA
jgi:hypothetical protein